MEQRTELCISVQEMGKRIGISKANAFTLANSTGFYPAFRIGKRILVNVEKLSRWLEEQQ